MLWAALFGNVAIPRLYTEKHSFATERDYKKIKCQMKIHNENT